MKKKMVRLPKDGKMLSILYKTVVGRNFLKILTNRRLSIIAGSFLDNKASRFLINPFIKQNKIDMSEYEATEYNNFNEFFCRNIKKELRVVDSEPTHFISPCDGLLSVYEIEEGLVIPVKQSSYSISSLLRDKKLAKEYEGGSCLVFRLCVNHYHRYCYVDDGILKKQRRIDGILHTVQPIALKSRKVFVENSREYSIYDSENFGRLIQMEVGALLVGRICNDHQQGSFLRGMEKGHFEYGGSTVIVLLKKDMVCFDDWMYDATKRGYEIPVKMGECLGKKK